MKTLSTDVRVSRVLRTASVRGRSLTERWTVLFKPEVLERARDGTSYLIDATDFAEPVTSDSPVIYRRRLPRALDDSAGVARLLDGTVPTLTDDLVTVNLADTEPMSEGDFWDTLSILGGVSTIRGAARLRRALEKKDARTIGSFAVRLRALVQALNSIEVAEGATTNMPVPGTDSFWWWRLSVIARGRGAVEDALRGVDVALGEDEWAAGEDLTRVAEAAYGEAAGVIADFDFGDGRPSGAPVLVYEQIQYNGRRDYDVMHASRLTPTVVGSLFVVDDDRDLWECLALQYVATEFEDVGAVVRELATEAAARFAGKLRSELLFYPTHGAPLHSGMEVFKRKQQMANGVVEHYAKIGIELPA